MGERNRHVHVAMAFCFACLLAPGIPTVVPTPTLTIDAEQHLYCYSARLVYIPASPSAEDAVTALEEALERLGDLRADQPLDGHAGVVVVEPELRTQLVSLLSRSFSPRKNPRATRTQETPFALSHVASGAPYFVGLSSASSNAAVVSTSVVLTPVLAAIKAASLASSSSFQRAMEETSCCCDSGGLASISGDLFVAVPARQYISGDECKMQAVWLHSRGIVSSTNLRTPASYTICT
jgi:hypothetical protein